MTIKEIEVKMQLGISEDEAIAAATHILGTEDYSREVLAALISKISSDDSRVYKNMNSIYSDLINFTEKDIKSYLIKDNVFYNNHKESIDSISNEKIKFSFAKFTVALNKILG